MCPDVQNLLPGRAAGGTDDKAKLSHEKNADGPSGGSEEVVENFGQLGPGVWFGDHA